MSEFHYYSHVINVGNSSPYNEPSYRAFTWVGQFVKPIVEKQFHERYWFAFYGNHGKLRIWTTPEDHNALLPEMERLLAHPALSRRLDEDGEPEEAKLTLLEDLGSDRFRPKAWPEDQQNERALKVLSVLHSLCELVIHSLRKTGDGHYFIENNENRTQNPDGSFYQSLHHLFCSITSVPTFVREQTLTELTTEQQLSNRYEQGQLDLTTVHDILRHWPRVQVYF